MGEPIDPGGNRRGLDYASEGSTGVCTRTTPNIDDSLLEKAREMTGETVEGASLCTRERALGTAAGELRVK